MNDKYNAKIRIQEIKNSIRNLQKDGLKVGITDDGNLYVENTTYTKTHCTNDDFRYAEIDCFAD